MDLEDESLQMHLLHEYNSVPARSQILHRLLLESLRSKDIKTFKSLVDQGLRRQPPILNLNYAFPNRSDETLLDMACKSGLPEFVQYLLGRGARVNRINESHNRAPIHFATENGHAEVLKVLLEEPTVNPNLEAGQQTALHIAVKKNDLQCADVLLEKGASPNIPNSKGITAIHMAAMKRQKEMVGLILEKSRCTVDLDSYEDYNNQTTRDVLQKRLPEIPLPDVQARGANVHDLKYYLNANDPTNFLKCLQEVQEDVVNNVAEDLIEMAVQRNFQDIVRALLERVKGTGCNLERAANLAVQKGYPDILRGLLNADTEIGSNLVLNACLELGIPGTKGSGNMSDRVECLKLILERDDVDVRCTDNKGNTPLHYAARAGCREAIQLLLEKGSYIGHMNNFGVPPVADIPAPTLSQYFDDCLQTKRERTNEYTIEYNYRCLMPHGTPCRVDKEQINSCAKREMDVFCYIANNSVLKHLLKHPLLSSFLYLKWRRIRHILYINFAFYVLFYLLLNWYILYTIYNTTNEKEGNNSGVANSSEETVNDMVKSGSFSEGILKGLTGAALFLLAFREVLQLISSPCHYIRSFENWLEIALIFLGVAILNGAGTAVCAVAILLSAWELVMLIGQYPRMSTGIEMFKTVSFNFMRFLFLYAFLILAFALAFFTLFKEEDGDFPDPGHSLFKTIIMLTGEFEADDLPYVYHPFLSRFIFVLFVFLIAIVLFNLLNGLAVSDTVDILGKAELVGLISRTELVAYVENIAVRTPVVHGSHCLFFQGFAHSPKCNPLAFLVRRILLFPNYLRSGRLSVKPQDCLDSYDGREYQHQHARVFDEGGKDKVVPTSKMDPHIIKQTKAILSKRGRESDTERVMSELEKMNQRLSIMEITLNSIKRAMDNNNFNVSGEDRTAD